MTDLQIPDEARKAAWDEFWYQSTAGADPEQSLSRALVVFSPLIVVAELERLAEDYRARRQPELNRCNIETGQCRYCDSIRARIEEFNLFIGARARELRPAAASPSEEAGGLVSSPDGDGA